MKMVRIIIILIFSTLYCNSILAQIQFDYPKSTLDCKEKTFFDTPIEDCYGWMENIESEKVIQWVNEQNKLTKKIFNWRTDIGEISDQLNLFKSVSINYVTQKNGLFFNYIYTSTAYSPSIYYKKTLNGLEKLLINPADISTKDHIDIKEFCVSDNLEYVAYSFNRKGSDWCEIKVNRLNGKPLEDHLRNVLFSNIEWKGDGFYYSKAKQTTFLSNYTSLGIYYHQLGANQSEDEMIFPNRYKLDGLINYKLSADKRFLIITEKKITTNLKSIYYIDFNSPNPTVQLLLKDLNPNFKVVDNKGDKFIIQTFHQNNYGILVDLDINNPTKWEELTPEIENTVLLNTYPLKDKLLCHYANNSTEIFTFYDYNGKVLNLMQLEEGMHITDFNTSLSDTILLFYVYNEFVPPIAYTLNTNTFEVKNLDWVRVHYNDHEIAWENRIIMSEDSTEIILDIYYNKKAGLENLPTILKTYGGFGVNSRNGFNPEMIEFVRNEGIYVFAHIRGGGEKGKNWSDAGKRLNKQNSINDFITTAEYLIENKITSANKLAITGTSHGALIVTSAALQRPELFKVVVAKMGVYDMLNFEKYTVGNLHVNEFGTVSDSLDFKNLKNYSPYHNISAAINYPHMLFMTSDHDDRVPPFHSYKMVAALQNNPAQKNTILLRSIKDYGHNGGTSFFNYIQDNAESLSFIRYKLNEKNDNYIETQY